MIFLFELLKWFSAENMSIGRRYLTYNEKAQIDLVAALSVYDINKETIKKYVQAAQRIPGLSSMNMQILAGAFMYLQYSGAFALGSAQQLTFDPNAWEQIRKKILPSVITSQSGKTVVPNIQTAMLRYIQQIQSRRELPTL